MLSRMIGAHATTFSMSLRGSRMFRAADLGSTSNRVGLNPREVVLSHTGSLAIVTGMRRLR